MFVPRGVNNPLTMTFAQKLRHLSVVNAELAFASWTSASFFACGLRKIIEISREIIAKNSQANLEISIVLASLCIFILLSFDILFFAYSSFFINLFFIMDQSRVILPLQLRNYSWRYFPCSLHLLAYGEIPSHRVYDVIF